MPMQVVDLGQENQRLKSDRDQDVIDKEKLQDANKHLAQENAR